MYGASGGGPVPVRVAGVPGVVARGATGGGVNVVKAIPPRSSGMNPGMKYS